MLFADVKQSDFAHKKNDKIWTNRLNLTTLTIFITFLAERLTFTGSRCLICDQTHLTRKNHDTNYSHETIQDSILQIDKFFVQSEARPSIIFLTRI